MGRNKIIGIAVFLSFTNLSAHSEVSHRLTLTEVVDIARRENPEIRAALKKWEATKSRVTQATTPEKPRLNVERMYAPRGKNVVSAAEEENLAFSQEIPFPTTLFLQGRLARREGEMAEANYRAREWEVLSRVKGAYAALYFSRRARIVLVNNAGLMRQFLQVTEAKYATGKASRGDFLKAQVELSKMLNTGVTLEQEEETARARLNSLLNLPLETPLAIEEEMSPKPLRLEWAQILALSLSHRPELAESAAALEQSETGVSLSRSEYLPDIMLQYRLRNMVDGPDTQDAMVGFSVPLWFWKQGARVREARAERDRAQAEYKALQNSTAYEVKRLYAQVMTDFRLIELYRTSVLPQAEEALRVSRAAYESDRGGFLDLLDAVRTSRDFQLEHDQHIADSLQSIAELERLTGTNLQLEEK